MARIKVNAEAPLYNGMPVTFRAPCNCSIVDGLTVCYGDASQQFAFSDAHGNNLAGLGNLFAKDAVVKAVLDTEKGRAFLQNADTNAYIEERLSKSVSSVNGQRGDVIITAQRIGAAGCEQREIDVTYEYTRGGNSPWEVLNTTKATVYISGNHFVVKANPCLQEGNLSYRINMSALPDGCVILGMANHPANNPKYTLMGSYMEDKAVRIYEKGNYDTPTLYFWGVIEGEGSGSGGGGADEPDWVQALIDMATDAKETADEALDLSQQNAKDIEELKQGGVDESVIEQKVEEYLTENPPTVDLSGYATEQYVNTAISVALSGIATAEGGSY